MYHRRRCFVRPSEWLCCLSIVSSVLVGIAMKLNGPKAPEHSAAVNKRIETTIKMEFLIKTEKNKASHTASNLWALVACSLLL